MSDEAKKRKPGPDPERLVIEGDPGAALDRLLGKHSGKPVVVIHDRPFTDPSFTPEKVASFDSPEKAKKWVEEEWKRQGYTPGRDLLSVVAQTRDASPVAIFNGAWN